MSCGGGNPNFRLLDPLVGWDEFDSTNLTGLGVEDPIGIRLTQNDPNAVDPADITAALLPARLTQGCAPCEWFLLTPSQPHSEVLHRDACQTQWRPLAQHLTRDVFADAAALTTWKGLLAISCRGLNNVQIWVHNFSRRIATIDVSEPGPIAFTRKGELLVSAASTNKIARFGLDGRLRGYLKPELSEEVDRLAVDAQNRIWVVTKGLNGALELWRAGWTDSAFVRASGEDLKSAFPSTGIFAESSLGFCFGLPSRNGFEASTCFSWCGKPLGDDVGLELRTPVRNTRGQLLTKELDSGISRCRWHRVALDADLPQGTSIEIAVATSEDAAPQDQGDPNHDPYWTAFPAGRPHPNDWKTLPQGSLDALIDQPPGRYLFLRLRLVGDGIATPVVRRIRIDFPRVSSLEHLPDVYRENAKAEDFTERFLSLFDASIADLDRVIERYPALLDPTGVPDQLLPWLAGFFDIGLDPTWDAAKRRKLLQNAPLLYRERGTLQGLQDAVNLVFGVKPAIEEFSGAGPWGAVGRREFLYRTPGGGKNPPRSVQSTARLGNVRLFGTARVRFRLGRSALGAAPLRSYGNPDQDPFSAGAYRFRVLVPPLPNDSPEQRQRLINLIDAQKPAHTIAAVRVGGTGFLLGFTSAVGVDTLFAPLAPPRLGASGNIRLNRQSILWPGARGATTTATVGHASIVGIQTIAG